MGEWAEVQKKMDECIITLLDSVVLFVQQDTECQEKEVAEEAKQKSKTDAMHLREHQCLLAAGTKVFANPLTSYREGQGFRHPWGSWVRVLMSRCRCTGIKTHIPLRGIQHLGQSGSAAGRESLQMELHPLVLIIHTFPVSTSHSHCMGLRDKNHSCSLSPAGLNPRNVILSSKQLTFKI